MKYDVISFKKFKSLSKKLCNFLVFTSLDTKKLKYCKDRVLTEDHGVYKEDVQKHYRKEVYKQFSKYYCSTVAEILYCSSYSSNNEIIIIFEDNDTEFVKKICHLHEHIVASTSYLELCSYNNCILEVLKILSGNTSTDECNNFELGNLVTILISTLVENIECENNVLPLIIRILKLCPNESALSPKAHGYKLAKRDVIKLLCSNISTVKKEEVEKVNQIFNCVSDIIL